jgi:hypothetical protein
MVHGGSRSEFLRTQHRHHEVDEASERDEAHEDVFHGGKVVNRPGPSGRFLAFSAHPIAEMRVPDAQGEEPDGQGDEQEIEHAASLQRNHRAA